MLLEQLIEILFFKRQPTMVVVALGSSPNTAIEKFALHFGYPTTMNVKELQASKPLTEHQLNLCTRKLIRSIFQNASELFQTIVRPTKVFIIARAAPCDDTMDSSFVVDWNLNPLKRRKGKRGTPTWIIRLRGLDSREEAEVVEEVEKNSVDDPGEGGEGIAPALAAVKSTVPCMSLSDDPMVFAAATPSVIGVPLSLLPLEGTMEVWSKFPKGLKSLKGPRGGFSK